VRLARTVRWKDGFEAIKQSCATWRMFRRFGQERGADNAGYEI
jgi:hypothetical protein